MQFEVGINNVSRKRYISSRSNFTFTTNLIRIAYPKIEQFYPIEKIFFIKISFIEKSSFFLFFPNSFITIVGTNLFNIDKFDLNTRVKHAIKIFSILRPPVSL